MKFTEFCSFSLMRSNSAVVTFNLDLRPCTPLSFADNSNSSFLLVTIWKKKKIKKTNKMNIKTYILFKKNNKNFNINKFLKLMLQIVAARVAPDEVCLKVSLIEPDTLPSLARFASSLASMVTSPYD